jgi:hypothetical protein
MRTPGPSRISEGQSRDRIGRSGLKTIGLDKVDQVRRELNYRIREQAGKALLLIQGVRGIACRVGVGLRSISASRVAGQVSSPQALGSISAGRRVRCARGSRPRAVWLSFSPTALSWPQWRRKGRSLPSKAWKNLANNCGRRVRILNRAATVTFHVASATAACSDFSCLT